jgi:NADPH:quinone reductase-like Zn-dependent oxidoreductase
VVNYAKNPKWGSAVRDLTGGEGVDLVVETMGPETIEQSIIAAARYSDIVLLMWKSPNRPALVIPGDVYGPKLASIRRLFVGSRSDLEAMIKAMAQHHLRPVIDKTFAFERLHDAYNYFNSRAGFGRVVVLGA